MKKYIAALIVCALLAVSIPAFAADKDKKAASTPAVADGTDAELKTALENRYWDMRMAVKAGDPAVYKKNMADDFVGIDLNDTKRNADQVVAALGKIIRDDTRKEKTTVNSVKLDGDKAEVDATYDLTAMRKPSNGPPINYHMVTALKDVWVKKDGQWLLQKTEAETGDVYVNDKLVAHRVRGQNNAGAAAADTNAVKTDEKKKP